MNVGSTCIIPQKVCPAILHTRKLHFALSVRGGAGGLLSLLPLKWELIVACCRVKVDDVRSTWNKLFGLNHWSAKVRRILAACTSCLYTCQFQAFNISCFICWLILFQGISPDRNWKSDKKSLHTAKSDLWVCWKVHSSHEGAVIWQ